MHAINTAVLKKRFVVAIGFAVCLPLLVHGSPNDFPLAVNQTLANYYRCVDAYSKKHAKSKVLASEIADASTYSCADELSAVRESMTDLAGWKYLSIDERNDAVSKIEKNGRSLAIKNVIDRR